MLICEQWGAEVWREGRDTGLRTPVTLRWPLGTQYQVEIRKVGFKTQRLLLSGAEFKTFKLVELKKYPFYLAKAI